MILFFDSTGLVLPRLERKLRARLPPGVVMAAHTSFPSFRQRLSAVQDDSVIAVMAAANKGQLQEFRELRNLFVEVRIILILPDHDSETVRLGHQLYPRYIGYLDGNADDLAAVAARMHEKYKAVVRC